VLLLPITAHNLGCVLVERIILAPCKKGRRRDEVSPASSPFCLSKGGSRSDQPTKFGALCLIIPPSGARVSLLKIARSSGVL